jgi:cysteine-rich repeat protein
MRLYCHLFATFACVLALAAPAAAVCGDGVVEAGEQCDLGVANCPPGVCCGTSCDSSCQLVGRCTGNLACCSTDADCPVGEGCCGNLAIEDPEQCDDGNRINGDCCSTSCEAEPTPCVPLPLECGALGPLNVLGNPSIRQVILRDSRPVDGEFDVNARDQFVLPDGLDIDPDTEIVSLFLTQNDGANGSFDLYAGTLDPGQCPATECFAPKTNANGLDKSWDFHRSTGMSIAPGWEMARFSRNLGFPAQIRESYALRNAPVGAPALTDGVRRVRSSVVLGDVCVTRLLDCRRNRRSTRYVCRETHCGDGVRQRGEQCGEPGLSCRPGKECDTCRCHSPAPQG